MTTSPPPDQPKAEEVSLEDIDKLLEAEDPEFAKQLEDVRSVEVDTSVEIEATVSDEDQLGTEAQAEVESKPATRAARMKSAIRLGIRTFRARLRVFLLSSWRDLILFLRTRPKEFALYAVSLIRNLAKKSVIPIRAFREASTGQKLIVIVLVAISATVLWMVRANLRGVWLPSLNEPILRSLEHGADSVETFDAKDGGESFYSAFPQERHEFLFRRMKVNLRRTADNPNPMGAFEVIVQVDSKDSAIELRDREVEFFDLLQRVFEDETFTDLEQELGKAKLKARLKRELNQKLTQGWVKDIIFKTFVLKP